MCGSFVIGFLSASCLLASDNVSAVDSHRSPPLIQREFPDQPPGLRLPHENLLPRRPAAVRAVGTLVPPVQVNVDADGNNIPGDAANEPSIAVDPTAPNRMVIGWRQFDTIRSNFRQAGVAYSHDGGRSWTNLPPLEAGLFRSDPVLASDSDGVIYYYSLRSSFLCDFFISHDHGMTWSDRIPAFGGDKEWFTIDTTGGIGEGNIYASWSVFAGCCDDETFIRSTDGATSFSSPEEIPGHPIFGTLAVGADGTLFVGGVDPSDFGRFLIARSINARNPAETPVFDHVAEANLRGVLEIGAGPNPAGLLGQVWVAVDRSGSASHGNVYVLCSTKKPETALDPMDVYIARSVDGGLTFQPAVRVNDDPMSGIAWQWFGTMSVAPNGRIDVIWNDTRDSPPVTHSTVYYAFSNDGGLTFSESAPITGPFNHFLGYPQQMKLGDYYQLVSDDVGAHLAFAATFNGEQDVYYLRLGDYDCNGNGTGDEQDIATGASADCNDNGIPDECEIAAGTAFNEDGDGVLDECECVADLDGDGQVGFADLIAILDEWGACFACPEDLDGSGEVGLGDLLIILATWGPCP